MPPTHPPPLLLLTCPLELSVAQHLTLSLAAVVQEGRHARAEAFKLADPVGQGGQGADDEEGPVHVPVL